jgi:hypothetical protein
MILFRPHARTDVFASCQFFFRIKELVGMKRVLSVFAAMVTAPAWGMTFGNPVTVIPLSSITSEPCQRVTAWDDARGLWVGVLNTGMPDLKVGVWSAVDNAATELTVDLVVSPEEGEQLQPAIVPTLETVLVSYHANTSVVSVPVDVNVSFGDPVTVASGFPVSTPAIAAAQPGHVSVVWGSHAADSDSILVSHSTDTGQTWSASFSARLATDPGDYQRSHPAIVRAIPKWPEFVLLWEDSWDLAMPGSYLVSASVSETQVFCNAQVGYRAITNMPRRAASLASDADGVVFGTYITEANGQEYLLFSSEEMGTFTSLAQAATGAIGQAQLDVRGETVLVVWEQNSKLFVRASLDRGVTWGPPQVITTVSSGEQPFVALRDNGLKAIVEYVAPGVFGGVRLVEVMLP